MNSIKIQQREHYLQEADSWDRALEFYKQENALLKTRLSKVLDDCMDDKFIEAAERFNNQFVFMDDMIVSLLKDIRQQKDLLQSPVNRITAKDKLIEKYQCQLRKEMEKFEKDFSKIRYDFNAGLNSFIKIS